MTELWPSPLPRIRIQIKTGIAGPTAPIAKRRFLAGEKFFDRCGRVKRISDFRPGERVKLKTRHGSLTLQMENTLAC